MVQARDGKNHRKVDNKHGTTRHGKYNHGKRSHGHNSHGKRHGRRPRTGSGSLFYFHFWTSKLWFPNSKDWVKKDKSGQQVQIATKTTGCRWMGPWVWVWPMDMGRRWRSLHSSWNKKKKLATLSRCARRGKLWLEKSFGSQKLRLENTLAFAWWW